LGPSTERWNAYITTKNNKRKVETPARKLSPPNGLVDSRASGRSWNQQIILRNENIHQDVAFRKTDQLICSGQMQQKK